MAAPAHVARENGKKGGRPRGSKDPHTLAKEQARDLIRERIYKSLLELVDPQIAKAKGLKYLVTRDNTGKFVN